jgi:AraC-like DNA-binding protein
VVFRYQSGLLTLDAAEESLRSVCENLRMRTDVDLRHTLRVTLDESLTALTLDVRGDVRSGSTQPSDAIAIVHQRTGRIFWREGGPRDGNGVWIRQPGFGAEADIGPVVQEALVLPLEEITRMARLMLGDHRFRVRFDECDPVDAEKARFAARTIDHVTELASLAAFDSELLRATVHRMVVVTMLTSFRLRDWEPQDFARTVAARRHAYTTAARYFDDHASLPITVDDAASVAGVGAAELRQVFLAFSPGGTTPSQYLLKARLSAAHDDLVHGDPTLGDTVGQIAARWGFSSGSAFARHYRFAYGERPRHVLER